MGEKSFGEFILGPCNRFAHAVVSSLAEGESCGGRITTVYGPEGAGKSHLLTACVARCRRRGQRAVRLTAVEVQGAVREQVWVELEQEIALLATDDLDLLPPQVQRKLLGKMTALAARGTAVVLSCETFPAHNRRLAPGFLAVLEGGLIADLHPLDPDTRFALAARVAAECGLDLPADLRGWVRDRLPGHGLTVRQWVVRFAATLDVTGEPPSARLAERVREELRGGGTPGPERAALERAVRRLAEKSCPARVH